MVSATYTFTNQTIGRQFSAQAPLRRKPFSAASAVSVEGSRSLYEVLGIENGATSKEIKSAYRRLAKVMHPDVVPGHGASSGHEFMRVHEAYATLSDPERRAAYDGVQCYRGGMLIATAVDPVNHSAAPWRRRNWETDQCW